MDRNYYRSQWKVPIMIKNKRVCVCVCVCVFVCVRACIWACNIVSRHPSPDSTPNEKAALSIQSSYISSKCLSWSKRPPLTDATFYSAHAFCSVSPCIFRYLFFSSLHVFLYAGSVSEPRGGLADLQLSTGRRWEMYLHSCGSSTEHV